VALTEQMRKNKIAGLLEERRGVEAQLAGAEEAANDKQAQECRERLEAIADSLKYFGASAGSPYKRAEKRPAATAETRKAPSRRKKSEDESA
jgi:hypothetical protein